MTDLNLERPILIRVLDTETTGLGDDAALVEIGYTDLKQYGGGEWAVLLPHSTLINPGRPIPPEASAIHHIRDCDIASAPSPDKAFIGMRNSSVTHFAAHNAAFDRRFFGGGETPWICTLKAAYRAFPGAPKHGNQVIRYLIDLDDSEGFDIGPSMPPHRAGPDSYVTAHILRFLLENGMDVEAMVEWTNQHAILPRLTFGKNAGPWADVPTDYLEWMTRQRDLDADAKHTAKHWLKKRKSQ